MKNTILASTILYSALAVFLVVFVGVFFLYVRPTRSAPDKDKLQWKRFWCHVEFVLLGTWMVAIAAAVPDAATVISERVVGHNQNLAKERLEEAHKFASYVAELRCNPGNSEFVGMCRLTRQFLATDEISAQLWADLSAAFTKELEVAGGTFVDPNGWPRIEVMNLANYAREVSGFAADRDRFQSSNVVRPIPWQVLMFWPHLLAFGFALKLAKTVAGYSLL